MQPVDRPSIVTQYMTASTKIGLYILAFINLACVLFFMICLIVYRRTRLLKASQPNMMWIVVIVNLFNVARTLTSTFQASVTTCTLSTWFGHLAFITVIAMFAKTLRVFIIIKSGLKRVRITATHVFTFTAYFCAAWVFYLIFFSIFALPTVFTYVQTAINGQDTIIQRYLDPVPQISLVLYVVEFIFLLCSAVLCYATRVYVYRYMYIYIYTYIYMIEFKLDI